LPRAAAPLFALFHTAHLFAHFAHSHAHCSYCAKIIRRKQATGKQRDSGGGGRNLAASLWRWRHQRKQNIAIEKQWRQAGGMAARSR
jgi:hypothetical protein